MNLRNTLAAILLCGLLQAQSNFIDHCEGETRSASRSPSNRRPSPVIYGVNHYEFDEPSVSLLRELDPARAVPVRVDFDWQSIQPTPETLDFSDTDQMVNDATAAGVPILGIVAYSTTWSSSMPQDFDLTEVAPFKVVWRSGTGTAAFGPLAWGTDDPQFGSGKYLWNVQTEDGSQAPRVAYLRPAQSGYIHGMATVFLPPGKSVILETRLGFLQQSAPDSRIKFSITYANGDKYPSLVSTVKAYDGKMRTVTVDVTALAGRTLNLFWNIDTISGFPAGDPIIEESRVLVDGVPLSMSAFLGDDVRSIVSYPPNDPDQFAAFAGQLAARYPQVLAWEVWNEPNLSVFWRPAPDPAAYARLLQKTYAAIKAGNPSATVLMGGLSGVIDTGYDDSILPEDFLNQVYQAGDPSFDVVAIHPYGDGGPGGYIDRCIQKVRDVMAEQGDTRKRIWITEFGWSTQGPGAVDEATQAANLCQARGAFERFPEVERVYWYCLQDRTGTPDFPMQSYGLFHLDGTPKPAARVFR